MEASTVAVGDDDWICVEVGAGVLMVGSVAVMKAGEAMVSTPFAQLAKSAITNRMQGSKVLFTGSIVSKTW
jgi:hypothetical protein